MEDFIKQFEQTIPPSHIEKSVRVLGLVFAEWNGIVSAMLATVALWTNYNPDK